MSALDFKNKGNEFVKNHQFQLALEAYTDAINLDDQQSVFFSNRAHVFMKLELYGAAVDDCTKAIALDSNNIKAFYRRGVSFIALLEYKKGLADLKKILAVKPSDANTVKAVAQCEKILKRIAFEKAIASDDDVAECSSTDLSAFPLAEDVKVPLEIVQTGEKNRKTTKITNMSQEFITWMVKDLFLQGKTLPKKYAMAIVMAAHDLFKQEPTVVEISNQSLQCETISICGDTHGQFYDVLNLFKKFGKVGPQHAYLFNGDFVDRGSWSCEVALLYYCLKLLYPNRMFLNRGNHETNDMNKVYGFQDEVKHKYSDKLFTMFSESFNALPLCTVVNNDYMVLHGGLFSDDDVSLNDIKKLNRFSQPPVDSIFMELLWTDPQHAEGRGPSQRGRGVAFGPDVTKRFLEKNNLKKIIRSHEVRMGGYELEHDGNLITVFSAPNYCDSQGNLGAVINVHAGADELDIQTFSAVEHPPMKPMAYSNGFGF